MNILNTAKYADSIDSIPVLKTEPDLNDIHVVEEFFPATISESARSIKLYLVVGILYFITTLPQLVKIVTEKFPLKNSYAVTALRAIFFVCILWTLRTFVMSS